MDTFQNLIQGDRVWYEGTILEFVGQDRGLLWFRSDTMKGEITLGRGQLRDCFKLVPYRVENKS